jgi:hypothetical protein
MSQGTVGGFDTGVRPLLLALYKAGYATESSNLASSGTAVNWTPSLIFHGRPPSGAVRAVSGRAPPGWEASGGGHDDAIVLAPTRLDNPWSTRGERPPDGETRLDADRALVLGVRSVI